MSRTKENGVTIRNRIFGNDRRTSLHHLGIALALFVAIFGAYYLMSFFNSYLIPFGPATFVVIVGIGLIASVLSAYWNNGLVVSFLLAISAPLSLVTAVDVLELAAPRAPYLVLASWAIAFGLGIGICGYLLGVVAAWLEQREERGR